MTLFDKTDRNKVRRLPERGVYDTATIYAIVDEALICHVGFVHEGQPFVIPTIHAREGDTIYLHGAKASRLLEHARQGEPICISVTLLDGIVVARSAFHSSMNYRSAVLFGRGRVVEETAAKLHAVEVLTEHVLPGRWAEVRATTEKELNATSVVAVAIESASAKTRSGPPSDDEEDYALPIWAGVLPIRQEFLPPIADPKLGKQALLADSVRHATDGRGYRRITLYPDIDPLLHELRSRIHQVLDQKLVGLYLYGSLVTGDFDHVHSDIDLLAVIDGDLGEEEFARLDAMHTAFVTTHPAWHDRVEIAYLAQQAIKTFRTQVSPIAVISPGEPFHAKEAGKDWLINWWIVRGQGVALYGPPAHAIIDPITDEEFQRTVREQVEEWRTYIYAMPRRKSQAYAILTMCRALHAYVNGRQVSKREAAEWAATYFPEWAPLIHAAWSWRVAPSDDGVDHAATFAETVRFVQFAGDYMGVERPLGAADSDDQNADHKHDVEQA